METRNHTNERPSILLVINQAKIIRADRSRADKKTFTQFRLECRHETLDQTSFAVYINNIIA